MSTDSVSVAVAVAEAVVPAIVVPVEQVSVAQTIPVEQSSDVKTIPNHLVAAEVDPQTYVTNLHASSHLVFVIPLISFAITNQIKVLNDLLKLEPPTEVATWLSARIIALEQSIESVKKAAHETNAKLLAERIVHKFNKWGPVRFGLTEQCQRCFYTGDKHIDSKDNPITLDPVLEAKIRELSGDKANVIINNLHIGAVSAKRFSAFIHVNIPVSPLPSVDDELDYEDEEGEGEDEDEEIDDEDE